MNIEAYGLVASACITAGGIGVPPAIQVIVKRYDTPPGRLQDAGLNLQGSCEVKLRPGQADSFAGYSPEWLEGFLAALLFARKEDFPGLCLSSEKPHENQSDLGLGFCHLCRPIATAHLDREAQAELRSNHNGSYESPVGVHKPSMEAAGRIGNGSASNTPTEGR